jgi:hypothetical protein
MVHYFWSKHNDREDEAPVKKETRSPWTHGERVMRRESLLLVFRALEVGVKFSDLKRLGEFL